MTAASVALMGSARRLAGNPVGADEETELIRLFLEQRDPLLFAQLVKKYERPVFRLAASVLGPGFDSAAEDLTQEIFVHVFHQLGSFRFASRFSTWLYRVAYRKAIDEKRKARYSRHHVGEEALAGLSATEPDPLRASLEEERDRAVRRAVSALREPHRTVVLLFYWMESPVEEIAMLLSTKPATVRSYLFRARAKLRQEIGDDDE